MSHTILSMRAAAIYLILVGTPFAGLMVILRTSINLISGTLMWFYCAIIIFSAVAGKLGGSMISARINGMPWRESAAIGILMNTRGLVELVILNIGLDMRVLSPALFSMMVLMALTTTFIATPLLQWIYPERLDRSVKETAGRRVNIINSCR